jgi:hypothetical protein
MDDLSGQEAEGRTGGDRAPDELGLRAGSAETESRVGDNPGDPTWPITATDMQAEGPPPVGINWGRVSQQLGIPLQVLEHNGSIVLAGEYVPSRGYFIDAASFRGRNVQPDDMAYSHGYFLGEIAARGGRDQLPGGLEWGGNLHPVVPGRKKGPIIGLFRGQQDAERARSRIVQGSIGSATSVVKGPLGVELRVERPVLGGRVASVMAGHGGAIISIGGEEVATAERAASA